MEVMLRAMTLDDAETLAQFESEVEASPWSARNFCDSLQSGHQAWVLEQPHEGIVAWVVIMTALDEAELLIIGVKRQMQRRGFGRKLLNAALDALANTDCARVFLEVRASNLPAQNLYRSTGFLEVGRRKGYYPVETGEREDAVLMKLELSERHSALETKE